MWQLQVRTLERGVMKVEFQERQKELIRSLAEGILNNVFDKDLYKNKLINSSGILTDKGLAYAVGYCDLLMSKRFERFQKDKAKWSEMLKTIEPYINHPEELDVYFKANMQSYVENGFFRPDGSFKDGSDLSADEVRQLRLTCAERFLQIYKYDDSSMKYYMEMARKQLSSENA